MTPTNDKACGEAGQGAKAGTDDERILSNPVAKLQSLDWRTRLASGHAGFRTYAAWDEPVTGRRLRRMLERQAKKGGAK
jgi:hypothetical protein